MLQSRVEYIADVNKYINKSKSLLNDVLDVLGWQKDTNNIINLQNSKIVTCPNDDGHRVPETSVKKHILKCSLHKNGYSLKDNFFAPPDPGNNAIVIDEKLQNSILEHSMLDGRISASVFQSVGHQQSRPVPQTADRAFSDFTAAERLAIYDYAVKHTSICSETRKKNINLPFNKNDDNSKPKTLEELLAAERDAKRRRIKYKSKKVHTSRKTQTEILREVIQSQMEGYEEWLNNQGNQPTLNVVKTEPESSSDKPLNHNKSNLKTINRDWDDWYYRYKGNPYKRYLAVIQEERDTEQRKITSKERDNRKKYERLTYSKEEYHKKVEKRYKVKDDDHYRSNKKDSRYKFSRDYQSDKNDYDWDRKNERSKRHYDKRDDSQEDGRGYENSYSKYKYKQRHKEAEYDEERRSGWRYDKSPLKDSSDTNDNYRKRHKSKKHKHKKTHRDEKHKSTKHDRHKSRGKHSNAESSSANSSDSS